jgi:hypothetical protein
MKRPVELLEDTLKELQDSLDKSVQAFEQGRISELMHQTHLENIKPMIEEYKYVLRVVNTYS